MAHTSGSPSARAWLDLAYDAKDRVVVAFGGKTTANHTGNFTWLFSGSKWTQLNLSPSPVRRGYTAMTYDNASQQVILFGGLGYPASGGGGPLNDTWTYGGGRWTMLHPIHSPPPLLAPFLTYDVMDRGVILYGGFASYNASLTSGSPMLNQTWEFKAGDWKRLGGSTPPTDYPSAMAYDPANHTVVLVGYANYTSANRTVATWLLSGGAWTRMPLRSSPHTSFFCSNQAMIYDARDGFLLLSVSGSGPGSQSFWKFAQGHWTKLTPSVAPRQFTGFGMVYDATDHFVVQFGGVESGFVLVHQTWEY